MYTQWLTLLVSSYILMVMFSQMVQMLTEKCTFQENVITELQREAEYYAEVRTEFDMASSQIKSQR